MKKLIQTAIVIIFVLLPSTTSLAAASPAITVSAQPMPTTQITADTSGYHEALSLAKKSWPYYITRASGLVATAILGLLIILGIGLVTGHAYRLMEPVAAWAVHRALGIALGITIAIHGLSLLFDKYVRFNIFQVLVPFLSHYDPVKIAGISFGSLWTALGIFAAYAAAIIIVSSLLWREKKPGTWRLLHYLSYLLVVLVFFHGLYLGVDVKHGALRILWISGGIVILVGIILRLRRARTIDNDIK